MVLVDAVFWLLWDMLSSLILGTQIISLVIGTGRELTPHSIQTWALEEARRRLEAEGILKDPEAKE